MLEWMLTLLDAIADLPDRPADVGSFVRSAPAAGALPEPQLS
jgi:hypothetical protein